MKRLSLFVMALVAISCTGVRESESPAGAIPSATVTATAVSTPSLERGFVVTSHPITGVGGRAVVSPDGKWIATPESPPAAKVSYIAAALIYDLQGTLARKVDAPGGSWRWMSDSSGLFVALDTPQRAPSLGVVGLAGGAPRPTGLQMKGASLSHDGKWIVADQQQFCCVAIEQKEIWIAPRDSGVARVFARTTTDKQQPLAIVGVDAQDRVVYRDASEIRRLPIAGGATQVLGSLAGEYALSNEKDGTDGDVSPDGSVMLIRGFEPVRWYVVANDHVTPWADSLGAIVEDRQGLRLAYYAAALWAGPHTLLVRAATGELAAVAAQTGLPTALKASLDPADVPLAAGAGRLLVARGKRAIVIELATGRQADAGIDVDADVEGTHAAALPSGSFIVSTSSATYRID